MKRLWLILFVINSIVFASGNISGKVYDPSGKPKKSVRVRLLELNKGKFEEYTYTTDVGYYEFKSVPNGDYELTFFTSYHPKVRVSIKGKFIVKDNKTIDIKLNPDDVWEEKNYPPTFMEKYFNYIFLGIVIMLLPFVIWFIKEWQEWDQEEREKELLRKNEEYKSKRKIAKKEKVQSEKKIIPNNDNTVLAGTGFLITKEGYVVTAQHVIKDSSTIIVRFPKSNKNFRASVFLSDEKNDISILKIPKTGLTKFLPKDIPFSISNRNKPELGQDVYSYGYPLGEDLGSKPSFSDGTISSFEGLKGDTTVYRISNPIQPGNSGGPLVDSSGKLIGIIVSSLDALSSLDSYGVIPQNLNFAVKVNYLVALLGSSKSININSNYSKASKLTPTDLTKKILPFVPQIRTNMPPESELEIEKEEPKGLIRNIGDGLKNWIDELDEQ